VLRDLYDYYQGQDFVLIAVTDESVSAIEGWIASNSVEYAVAKDNSGATRSAYGATGIPYHWIVGKHGNKRWSWGTGATLDDYKAAIDSLLGE
jgi:peroxiredoxin